jgi:hypothetical protein
MEVIVKGPKSSKKVRLGKSQFVNSGGEGSIYASHGVAFKIYQNSKAVIPYSKIKELSLIQNHNVIKPENIVLSNKNKPVGYTMRHIPSSYSLCQIFPKAFRDRNNLETDSVLSLIQKMQNTISDIHKEKILLVDLNEMNFLVDKKFKDIYFIDVDSYQTPGYPATALMETVRDRHSKTFNELTDWFSFGIVSFQMFVGLHPYKGKHPSINYPHDKMKQLDERMIQNIPVFHKDVKYPKNVLSFDIIPQAYKDWYKALFFDGKRFSPPTDPVQVIIIPVVPTTVIGNEDFDITEIKEYDSNIIRYFSKEGNRIVITKKKIYDDNWDCVSTHTNNKNVTIVPFTNDYIDSYIKDNNQICMTKIKNDTAVMHDGIIAEDLMSYDGRLYIKNKDIVSEMTFIPVKDNYHAVPKTIANVMENATKFYDGVAIQNVLGTFMASIFPESGMHYQIQCPEFKGYQIVDAKYRDNVLIVIARQKGKYDKFILKFNSKFSSYSLRKIDDISYCGINFTVLDNGVVVHINENEEIEIFFNKEDSNTLKVIDSPLISGDMKLFNDGNHVIFSKGKKLYKLKMKSK